VGRKISKRHFAVRLPFPLLLDTALSLLRDPVIGYGNKGNEALLQQLEKRIRDDEDIVRKASHLPSARQVHEAFVQMIFIEGDNRHGDLRG
jgi:hypothetical protein